MTHKNYIKTTNFRVSDRRNSFTKILLLNFYGKKKFPTLKHEILTFSLVAINNHENLSKDMMR